MAAVLETIGYIAMVVVNFVATYGNTLMTLGSIAYSAYNMVDGPDTPDTTIKGRSQIVRSAVEPHRIVYGECMVSGPLVYSCSNGSTKHIDNLYIWLVIVLASHEVEEIGDVYLNGTLATDPKYGIWDGHAHETFVVPAGGVCTIPRRASTVVNCYTEPFSGKYLDPTLYTADWNVITFDASLVGQTVVVNYRDQYVLINKHLGSPDQTADEDLIAASGGQWTVNHRLRGRAYIVVRLEWAGDLFPTGLPNIKAVVKGKKLYDPRTETTAYTNNMGLCMLDYLTAPHGLNCSLSEINLPLAIAAANVSDEDVQVQVGTGTGYFTDGYYYETGRTLLTLSAAGTGTILDGDSITITVTEGTYTIDGESVHFPASVNTYECELGLVDRRITLAGDGLVSALPPVFCAVAVVTERTEKRYVCNGAFGLDMTPTDVMKKLLSAGVGHCVWSQGKYDIWPAYYAAPVMTLTETDLRDEITVQANVGQRDKFNTVRGTFIFPHNGWQQTDFPPVIDTDAKTADGQELAQNLTLDFTTSSSAAQRLSKIHLNRGLRGVTVNFPAKMTAFLLKPRDRVLVTLGQLGWTAREFIVESWTLAERGGVDLVLKQDDSAVYDWHDGLETPLKPTAPPDLPDPWLAWPPENLVIAETLYSTNVGSAIKSRVTLSWTATSVVPFYEIQQQAPGGDWEYVTRLSETAYTIYDVEPGVWNYRVRAINSFGVASSWLTNNNNIQGKTAPPPACGSFLINIQPDGTREFAWGLDNPPIDLAGYRIRYQTGLGASWANMTPLHTDLLIASPYETNQLPAGTYTFAIVAEDTTGNQSDPLYIEADLGDPRLAGVIADLYPHKDNWPDTKTNCYVDEWGRLISKDQKTWASFPTDGVTWDSWKSWARNPYLTITYETAAIDLDAVLTFSPQIAVYGNGSITTLINYSSDGSSWSGWTAPGNAALSARYIKVKTTNTVTSGLACIYSMTVYLSGKTVSEVIENLNTASLTGGYRLGVGDVRLPISKTYSKILRVNLTLQSVGAGASSILVDKDTTTGPRVRLLDGFAATDAVIDASIEGI